MVTVQDAIATASQTTPVTYHVLYGLPAGIGTTSEIARVADVYKAKVVRLLCSSRTTLEASIAQWCRTHRVHSLPHYLEQARHTPWVIVMECYGSESPTVAEMHMHYLPELNGTVLLLTSPSRVTEVCHSSDLGEHDFVVDGATVVDFPPNGYCAVSDAEAMLADESGWGRRIVECSRGNGSVADICHSIMSRMGCTSYDVYKGLGAPEADTTSSTICVTNQLFSRLASYLATFLPPQVWVDLCCVCLGPRVGPSAFIRSGALHVDSVEWLLALRIMKEDVPNQSYEIALGLYLAVRRHHAPDEVRRLALAAVCRVWRRTGTSADTLELDEVARWVGTACAAVCPLEAERLLLIVPTIAGENDVPPLADFLAAMSDMGEDDFTRLHGALNVAYDREATKLIELGRATDAIEMLTTARELLEAELPPYHPALLVNAAKLLVARCRVHEHVVALYDAAAVVRNGHDALTGLTGGRLNSARAAALNAVREYCAELRGRTSDEYEINLLNDLDSTSLETLLKSEAAAAVVAAPTLSLCSLEDACRHVDVPWLLCAVDTFILALEDGRGAEALALLARSEGLLCYMVSSDGFGLSDCTLCPGRQLSVLEAMLSPRVFRDVHFLGLRTTLSDVEAARHVADGVRYRIPFHVFVENAAKLGSSELLQQLLDAFRHSGVDVANVVDPKHTITTAEVLARQPSDTVRRAVQSSFSVTVTGTEVVKLMPRVERSGRDYVPHVVVESVVQPLVMT